MTRTTAIVIAVTVWCFAGTAVLAQGLIDLPLADPGLEARAIALHKRLRCLVCQNQSIHESNAELARDLRVIVRERLAVGDTDEQTVQFLVDRYGDWVLLNPPFKPATLLLWLGPLVILLTASAAAAVFLRRRLPDETPQPLTDDERAQVRDLLRKS